MNGKQNKNNTLQHEKDEQQGEITQVKSTTLSRASRTFQSCSECAVSGPGPSILVVSRCSSSFFSPTTLSRSAFSFCCHGNNMHQCITIYCQNLELRKLDVSPDRTKHLRNKQNYKTKVYVNKGL